MFLYLIASKFLNPDGNWVPQQDLLICSLCHFPKSIPNFELFYYQSDRRQERVVSLTLHHHAHIAAVLLVDIGFAFCWFLVWFYPAVLEQHSGLQHVSDLDSLPCVLSAVKHIGEGRRRCRSIQLLLHSLTFGFLFFFPDGSQDCLQTFLPLGRIIRDHAVHPSCWLRLLSGAFPSVQTVSEVNPGAAVGRAGCCHRVGQVRLPFFF